ncbi:MAG: acetyl/propionyl/methylcrotonyl-CoA carboxylase subunit alpha [bacterium]
MSRILIANRGEIALRVIRACQELGHEAVIVHSEADEGTRPVRVADRSVCIGPADLNSSYMDEQSILSAAKMVDADAIHPGYGMLSENAGFAERVEESPFVFVGPASDTIHLMGQKSEARARLSEAGMPVLPGSDGDLTDYEEAEEVAEEVGYPIMLKASQGGGGRGISKVMSEDELEDQFQRVQSESEAAFGSEKIYIEKFIEDPRHIEFQVVGDGKGDVLHLYERECSIQRRHQKLLEEAPSPAMTKTLRDDLTADIMEALSDLKYSNVGTLEMVYDESAEEAYVIEVNTRIQVEHPVSEMITGRDLIRIQIETALEGELPIGQSEIDRDGHSMEVRVCAENPHSGFSPDQGTIEHLNFPSGPGVRVDSYIETGTWISPYYDSMIGKIITWDSTRSECIERMKRALGETEIEGISTTIPLFEWILDEETFRAGDFDTGYIDAHRDDWKSYLGSN